MRKKILIFGLFIFAGLLFSMPAFATNLQPEHYERTPADYIISNPVNFFVYGTYAELRAICVGFNFNYWGIQVWSKDTGDINSFVVASTTTSQNFLMTLPLGTYQIVSLRFKTLSGTWYSKELEMGELSMENGWDIMFEVEAPPPPPPPPPPSTGGNIITIPADFATSALAYAGNTFSSVAPLILIGMGLMLAFWLISNALRLTNILDKTKSKKINSWDFFDKEQKEKFKKDDWL